MHNDYLKARIEGTINADKIICGKGVVVGKNTVIRGPNGPAKRVILGDFSFINDNTQIMVSEFEIGEYSTIHSHCIINGKYVFLGHNCWIGDFTILNGTGGLILHNGVGIGAHSQIWTHMKFGDVIEGCRFLVDKKMTIGEDAWFVGHCIVSPVNVGEKSMAMVGSVITKDMKANHIYAGVPAKDITKKMGKQFKQLSIKEKENKLNMFIEEFISNYPKFRGQIKVITSPEEVNHKITCFDVSTRKYNKTYSEAEVAFMKKYVPIVKFIPA